MSRLPRLALLTLATSALLAACGGGSNDAELQLNLRGLENLGANAVYEGWVIVNGSPVTTGRFTVNDAGTLSQTRFPLGGARADAASTFVLTIEPASGDAPGPTDIRLLAGDFNAGKTEASSAWATPWPWAPSWPLHRVASCWPHPAARTAPPTRSASGG